MRVAVVEDDAVAASALRQMCLRYDEVHDTTTEVIAWSSGVSFLKEYKANLDVIILDIQMPGLDGLAVARHIRERDRTVPIIFVTSAPQYAVEGYTVDALSYLVKPVAWADFDRELTRAFHTVRQRACEFVTIRRGTDVIRLPMSEVVYVETTRHGTAVHTFSEIVPSAMTMRAFEEQFPAEYTCRINSSFIVNLHYVEQVHGSECTMVTGDVLRISRPRKRAFIDALTRFGAGGAST